MKRGKRLLAALVVAATLAASVAASPPVRAASFTTSENGIAFIKEFEGFRSRVYWDGGYAYIGYGTMVRSSDYPGSITEAKADSMLREALRIKEQPVNDMNAKYNLKLTQNQFDALLSFTYNIGTSWMDSDYRLYSYLVKGISNYTDIEIVNAMGAWCHMGGSIVSQLVTRRLREAKMFLYNDYKGSSTHDYKYLKFDAAGGSVDSNIQFFETGKPYAEIQTPTRDGYAFGGWYTSGGSLISPTAPALQNMSVTASWKSGSAPPVQTQLFPDVSKTDWFYKYVVDLSAKGIVGGYPDGAFHPTDTSSGGVALKLILMAVGFGAQQPTGSNWASGFLTLAQSKGIVEDGALKNLDDPVSRLTIAKIAARALGLPAIEEPETTFADTSDGYVLTLYHAGIITGSQEAGGLMFYPDKNISRAELSTIVWRITNSGISQS